MQIGRLANSLICRVEWVAQAEGKVTALGWHHRGK
jgi:hypothetical protein